MADCKKMRGREGEWETGRPVGAVEKAMSSQRFNIVLKFFSQNRVDTSINASSLASLMIHGLRTIPSKNISTIKD